MNSPLPGFDGVPGFPTPRAHRPSTWSVPASAGALLFLFLPTCGGPSTPEPIPEIEARDILYHHDGSGIADSVRLVIRDEAGLEQFWDRATARDDDPPAVPSVDFERSMVLAVGAGLSTPGDQIHVDSAGVREVRRSDGEEEDVMRVFVRTVHACGDFQADTYPLQVVRVQRFDGPVEFIESSQAGAGCGMNPRPAEPGVPPSP